MEDVVTHGARAEEERTRPASVEDSTLSRLRSSARLGFVSGSSSSTFASASTVVAPAAATCRTVSRRKRKKRRRQRRAIDPNIANAITSTSSSTRKNVATTVANVACVTNSSATGGEHRHHDLKRQQSSSKSRNEDDVVLEEEQDDEQQQQQQQQQQQEQEDRQCGSSSADITLLNRRTGKRAARRCNNDSNSGRRNAMTMDLQRLINEVHARPAIWDQKNVNYHNRDVILKMWREIARACDVSTDVAKSKWKHLRDNFRNELKKTYRGKCDGSGSGGEHDSKWVWFKSLFFLRDQMNSRVIGCALNQSCGALALRSSPDGTQIEPQIDILEGHEETQFDDLDGDSCQSLLSNEDGLHHQMPPPKIGKIGRKRTLIETMENNEYPEMERKRYEAIQKRLTIGHAEEEDDTYHFLMSVRNPLRSLPLDRQMFVRLKIQELVYNEIHSQNHHHHHHQSRVYDVSSQDVKPPVSENDAISAVGSGSGGGAGGAAVADGTSTSPSLLQNCNTEGSSDDAFFA